jgi:cyclic-di-GMP-binding biofilm dispersal mediator protein
MTSVAGKHILITGATGGLGTRVAQSLIAEGATVSLTGRDEVKLNAVSATSARYTVDLSAPGAGRALLEAVTQVAPLDGIVMLHGAVAFGAVGDLPAETARLLTAINLDSVIEIIGASPVFLAGSAAADREPFILTISGVIADIPTVGMAAYGAGKAGVKAYVSAASRELRRAGIRLLDARPGHTMTELSQHPLAGVAPAMSAGLSPDDVAARLVQGILNDEKDLPAESFVV